jgi:hypothetical protein
MRCAHANTRGDPDDRDDIIITTFGRSHKQQASVDHHAFPNYVFPPHRFSNMLLSFTSPTPSTKGYRHRKPSTWIDIQKQRSSLSFGSSFCYTLRHKVCRQEDVMNRCHLLRFKCMGDFPQHCERHSERFDDGVTSVAFWNHPAKDR